MEENLSRVIITDLDGTLCDISHRLHFITEGKKDYESFFDACHNDKPHMDIIRLVNMHYDGGYTVRIVSGRSDRAKAKTIKSLQDWGVSYDDIIMREDKCTVPDDVLKEIWLKGGLLGQQARIELVLEDRLRVVNMWRSNGLRCLQVAAGSF